MRCGRIIRILIWPMFLLTITAGCQSLYRYRPIGVLVQDAETMKPIPGAQVRLSYPLVRSSVAPYDSSGTTGPDGIARLRAAPCGESVALLEVSGPGYLSESMDVSSEAIEHIEPAPWFGTPPQRPANFVLKMLAGPRFAVELVLPTGYRGLVVADVQFLNEVPCPPGQRRFSYEVPSSGRVQVRGPGLLLSHLPDYGARYADGTVLGPEMDAVKVGFRWLKQDGPREYFVVGTQPEYESYRLDLLSHSTGQDSRPSGGGQGGGRGGRHHGGNSMPSQ